MSNLIPKETEAGMAVISPPKLGAKTLTYFFYLVLAIWFIACGPKKPERVVNAIIQKKISAKENTAKIIWVAIAPYHGIDSVTTALIGCELSEFYGIKTILLPHALMSDSLLAWSKTRYNANKILSHLSTIKPNHVGYILALTDDRIAACGDSTHETGVAGLGTRPGYCAIVSTAALRLKLSSEEQFIPRLIKACLHEMGHNFGLKHCKQKDKKCFMRDAGGTVRTLDEEEIYLCEKCRNILEDKGFKLRDET